ncbi:MAG TPA: winged helix-turn-helix transcriptional regulator [Methanocella sp.]|nr:winged helix-turn-helix transcriptional regulator [Methanocella sp.]
MQSKGKLCMALIVLLIVFHGTVALAEPGGYTVRPGDPEDLKDYQGSDRAVSFWELPLWIKLFYVGELLGALGAVLAAFKLVPFIFLTMRRRLDNRNRQSIYSHIQENPGCTVSDIAKGEALNVGSVRYHVDRLENTRKIIRVKIGKFMRLFRNSGAYSDREITVIAALHVRTSRAIMSLIGERPGLSNKQIAQHLAIKESMAHQYLASLLKDGIVRYEKDGQQKRYFLEEDVDGIMKKLAVKRTDNSGFHRDAFEGLRSH